MAKKATKVAAKKKTDPAKKEAAKKERSGTDRRQKDVPVASNRRKVQRRRQIDPTTCERDYSQDEIEFMDAMDAYKRANGRMFPTCSEILEVVRGLGYARTDQTTPPSDPSVATDAASETQDVDGEEQVAVAVAASDSVDEEFEGEFSFEDE